MYVSPMRRSFKDSLKVLEADIQHANTLFYDFQTFLGVIWPQSLSGYCPYPTQLFFSLLLVNLSLSHQNKLFARVSLSRYYPALLITSISGSRASEFPREYDGAFLQMRMSYSPAAHFFLFLVQWTDCQVAGALGLLRILIYKVYVDGTTTMSTYERKASIREFYAVIYPSLLQLESGVTDTEDKKQKAVCMERYQRKDGYEFWQFSDAENEMEEECGICMEMNSKVVLPNCNHVMCLKCYRDWHSRSKSCPFCRDSLKRVNSGDLWIYTDTKDVVDMGTLTRENLRRLFMYIEKLPLVVPDSLLDAFDSHLR